MVAKSKEDKTVLSFDRDLFMFKVISSIVCCLVLVFVYIMLMNLMTIIPLKLNGKNTKCIMHVYSNCVDRNKCINIECPFNYKTKTG
jgi:hypothetical protein